MAKSKKPRNAASMFVDHCTCGCGVVSLRLLDQKGAVFAVGSLSPHGARRVAEEIQENATAALAAAGNAGTA